MIDETSHAFIVEHQEWCKEAGGRRIVLQKRAWVDLLVRHEHLERRDKVSQGHASVSLPLLVRLNIVNEDEVVVLGALVMALRLSGFSSSHLGGVGSRVSFV